MRHPYKLLIAKRYVNDANLAEGGHPGVFCSVDGALSRIDQIEDLAGRVRIRTGEQALRYVRLLSSPQTFYYGSPLQTLEPCLLADLSKRLYYKDPDLVSMAKRQGTPRAAVLSPGEKWPDAKVTMPSKGTFEIKRQVLMRAPTGEIDRIEVLETVSPAGGYTCKAISDSIYDHPNKKEVFIPIIRFAMR